MSDTAGNTVVDYTIDALREAIRGGRLVPGQRLVVADITRMLGVSPGPIREAIRRLTGEGLVEITPHRGASVRSISVDDVREIFELRQAVEGLAARLAAERIDQGDWRARLTSLMAEMKILAKTENVPAFLENNQAYHDLISRTAGNERVSALAAQLILPLYQLRLPHRMDIRDLHQSYADHRTISAAILGGDPDGAEKAMREHIGRSGAALMTAMRAVAAPTPPRARATVT
uniref:Transcriptional regulator, GntR family n=1 Tax=Caulobacter sp. (strain K31) TaxID=366602 RepID=B0T6L5_CAUSK